LTVPSPLAIESTVLAAVVGKAVTVTVPAEPAVAPVGAILTVPVLLAIESTLLLAVVGIAVNVTVSTGATVAPVGVIFTVPSLFTIESTVVPADVGIAETLAVALAPVALVLRLRVFAPTFTEIMLRVDVGAVENVPVCDAAVGALAVKVWPSTVTVEVPPVTVPVPGVPETEIV